MGDKHQTKCIARAKAPRGRNRLGSSEKHCEAEAVGTRRMAVGREARECSGRGGPGGTALLQGPEVSMVLSFESMDHFLSSTAMPHLWHGIWVHLG